MMTDKDCIRCSCENCSQMMMQPTLDGWAYLEKWRPHIEDGWYCPAHADAILVEDSLEA
jgi:hypothetical protein